MSIKMNRTNNKKTQQFLTILISLLILLLTINISLAYTEISPSISDITSEYLTRGADNSQSVNAQRVVSTVRETIPTVKGSYCNLVPVRKCGNIAGGINVNKFGNSYSLTNGCYYDPEHGINHRTLRCVDDEMYNVCIKACSSADEQRIRESMTTQRRADPPQVSVAEPESDQSSFTVKISETLQTVDCRDSDGSVNGKPGKDIFTKGFIKGLDYYGKSVLSTSDGCAEYSGGANTKSGAYVVEEVCQEDQRTLATYHQCPEGTWCYEGACVRRALSEPVKPAFQSDEVCNDGRDNDADGKIDCFDADCSTEEGELYQAGDACTLENNKPTCCLFHDERYSIFVDDFDVARDCKYTVEKAQKYGITSAGRYPVVSEAVCRAGSDLFKYDYKGKSSELPQPKYVTKRCSDSDDGFDLRTKGTIKGVWKQDQKNEVVVSDYCGLYPYSGAKEYDQVKNCEGDNCYTWEYFCQESYIEAKQLPCPGGCNDGTCRQMADSPVSTKGQATFEVGVNNYPESKDYDLTKNVHGYLNVYNVRPVKQGVYEGYLRETLETGKDGSGVGVVVDYNEIVNFVGFKNWKSARSATTWIFSSPPYKNFGTVYEDKYMGTMEELCQINYLVTSEIMKIQADGSESCATSLSTPYQDNDVKKMLPAYDEVKYKQKQPDYDYEDYPAEEVKELACNGCMYMNKCVPYGFRVNYQDTPMYCDLSGDGEAQKQLYAYCENSFECQSNSCVNSKCVDFEKELKEAQGAIQRLLEKLKFWFN